MRQRIIVILVIVIALLLILTLTRGKPKSKVVAERKARPSLMKKPEEIKETVPIEKEKKPEAKKETKPVPAPIAQEEGWGEDPFVRDFSFLTEIKDLRLTAITISESKSYALINDMIVSVGDEIAGKKIVAIDKDKVVVEKGGKRFEVYLGQ
jgi:type II secretory pathway component PulC|uniref:Uncharacterized protein n=1 Tax=candidate division WOR-3 bacterium TaxID=2052148 RepID=A0A7C3V0C2_UNCW3